MVNSTGCSSPSEEENKFYRGGLKCQLQILIFNHVGLKDLNFLLGIWDLIQKSVGDTLPARLYSSSSAAHGA